MSKRSKRLLSWLLLAAMLCTLLPTAVFADDAAEELVLEPTEDAVVLDELEPQTEDVESEEPEEVSLEGELEADYVEASKPSVPSIEDTKNNPFVQGTGGSNSFRIPAMVTLSDGTLVAAADARWNTTYDGGGLDTMVAWSTDSGATWEHTFANYLGDNGDTYNGSGSTCFIDPALVVGENNTIYMLCDLYPYGVALNGSGNIAPSTEVGFDNQGRLLLSNNNHSSYDYYLDNGKIYSTSGTEVSGYTVDAYFNISENGAYVSNLFFSDSPYKVVRTGYLYLTKSTDKGQTWSAPTLLNNIKTESEMVCLVGPGRGLYTADEKIVFPVYSYNGSQDSQRMGFIYSTDGENWTRVDSSINWSSESAVVELTDGTLRFFYRNGTSKLCYVDYNMTNKSWGNQVQTDVVTNSNCQISAITYSKTIDGQQVILVSCPTGPNSNGSNESGASYRKNGKIFIGVVNEDQSMVWKGSVAVTSNDNQFMYSCLTELLSGNVSILYENQESKWGTGNDCYYTMDYTTYTVETLENAFGVTFDVNLGNGSNGDNSNGSNDADEDDSTNGGNNSDETKYDKLVELEVGQTSETFTTTGENYKDSATIGDTSVATMDVQGTDATSGWVKVNKSEIPGKTGIIGCSVGGTLYYIKMSRATVGYTTDASQATQFTSINGALQYTSGSTYYLCGTKRSGNQNTANLNASTTSAAWDYNCENGSGSGFYVTVTEWGNNKEYYLTYLSRGNNNGWSVSSSASNKSFFYVDNTTPASTSVSFNGVAPGTTYATVGNTKYKIVVKPIVKTQDVALAVDGTWTEPTSHEGCAVTYTCNTNNGVIQWNENTKTVTAKEEGTATLVVKYTKNGSDYATYTYKFTVSEGTPISIQEGKTTTLTMDATLADGQYIKWTTADSQHVGVAGAYDSTNNKETNSAILAGYEVTESPVVVTGTIYNADGTVSSTKKWLVTVTEGDKDTNTSTRHIYVDVETIKNCKVYYSINAGPLIEITQEDTLIDKDITGHFNIMFFAAPNEGYALTFMGVSGSSNQYYTLSNGNPDGTGSDAWPIQSGISDDNAGLTVQANENSPNYWRTVNNSMHGFRWAIREGNYTPKQMKAMFSQAIALGCDGATNFTKNGSESFYTQVRFVAQKLPTLKKEIVSVTHGNTNTTERYTEGMTIERGDTINYKVTVTEYAELTGEQWDGHKSGDGSGSEYNPTNSTDGLVNTNASYGKINYSQIASGVAQLTDELTDSVFYTDEEMTSKAEVEDFLGTSVTTDTDHVYYTELKLTDKKFATVVKEGKITNTANLAYGYKSTYSTGTLSSKADAEATIKVKVPEYVIDFGLPVTLEIPEYFGEKNESNNSGYKIAKAESAAGADCKISADGKSITYTPKKIMTGTDYVTLKISKDNDEVGAQILVHPANNVLYEETFATAESVSGWKPTGEQLKTSQDAPSDQDVYGYDSAYTGNTTYSNGTYYFATVESDAKEFPSATYNFTGTGFELMSECSSDTGTIVAALYQKNADGTKKAVKLYIVDTSFIGKFTNGTNDPVSVGTTYQIPVIQNLELDHGDYELVVRGRYRAANLSANSQVAVMSTSVAIGADVDCQSIAEEMGFGEFEDIEYTAFDTEGNKLDDGISLFASSSGGDKVYIDGIRVFGTMGKNEPEAYVEKGAEFESLWELANNSEWATKGGNGLVYVENVTGADTAYRTYKDYGPENEIYLAKNTGIAFKVTSGATVQVSAKMIAGSPKLNDADATLATQTALYYSVGKADNDFVVIYNDGEDNSILSLVDLKIMNGSVASATSITEDELNAAIYSIQNPTNPEEPSKPTEPENPEEPSKPTEPEEPENPEEPSKPTEPENPEEPSKPTEPENPEEPSKPTEPEEPEEPSKPTEPEEPENPSEPTEPEDPTENWENPFKDVIFGKFYYSAVRWFHAHGIINGMPNGEFGLNISTDRAMVITMLYRMEGEPEVTVTDQFSDVKKGSYYEKAVSWAVENYLVGGYPDGTFRPKQAITREELITILYRYNEFKGKDPAGSADLSGYADGDQIHKYAKNAMRWAIDNGIVNGYNEYGKNLVKPRSETRRSEMVTLLYRVWEHVYGN